MSELAGETVRTTAIQWRFMSHVSRRFWLSLAVAFLCSSLSALAFESIDVFARGENGYNTFRIPSLVVTKQGTLLAFCEGRKNGHSDAGDIDAVIKRSHDGGKTWSPLQVIWDDENNTCGNPCAVVDQTTGTIWLLLTRNRGEDHEADIHAGRSKETRTVWIAKSDDDGKTWTSPVNITASAKNPAWRWYATGPGIGIQIQNGPHRGRLVIPCDHSAENAQGKFESRSHVIYSDDHGATWQIGGVVQPKMNECQVVELSGKKGELLLSLRNDPKSGLRAQSTSVDGGVSWTQPEFKRDLIDPTCQASILRYSWPSWKNHGRILFCNPSNQRRKNLTIHVSYDDGNTWPVAKMIHEGPSAYSCMAVLGDQTVGCLYECGVTNAYEKIALSKLPLSFVEAK